MVAIGPSQFVIVCAFLLFAVANVYWISALADCLTKESPLGNDRQTWARIILFAYVPGAVIYFNVRRPRRIEQQGG